MVLRKVPIALVLVLGCGPGSPVDDAGDGETTSDCAPLPAAEVPPLETPDVCTAYFGEPPPSGAEVEVVIINDRDEPILLDERGSGCHHAARWFELDGEHEGHAVWLPLSNCEIDWPSCREFTDDASPCELCDTLIFPIYIEPGGRFITTYATLATIDVELPAECSITGAPEQCWAPTSLPAGTYQLRAYAGLASDCISEDCSCEVDENGSCIAPDWPNESNLEATLEWDTECDVIELTFER